MVRAEDCVLDMRDCLEESRNETEAVCFVKLHSNSRWQLSRYRLSRIISLFIGYAECERRRHRKCSTRLPPSSFPPLPTCTPSPIFQFPSPSVYRADSTSLWTCGTRLTYSTVWM